jgi:hypothetical protein
MNNKQLKQTAKDAKSLDNARIISSLEKYAQDNNWLHVNDRHTGWTIEHMVFITPAGLVIAVGVDSYNEVLVWNKT